MSDSLPLRPANSSPLADSAGASDRESLESDIGAWNADRFSVAAAASSLADAGSSEAAAQDSGSDGNLVNPASAANEGSRAQAGSSATVVSIAEVGVSVPADSTEVAEGAVEDCEEGIDEEVGDVESGDDKDGTESEPCFTDSNDPGQNSIRPARAAAPSAPATGPLYKLTFLMTVLGLTLVAVTVVPHFVEEVQYRMERGRQRAQVEIAQANLSSLPLAGLSKAYQLVSQRVGPSVVHINVTESPQVSGGGTNRVPVGHPRVMTGQGSGVIVDNDGYIVTNRHVVEGARGIDVLLSDGRRVAARIVGLDNATDLAVLRIDASGLMPAEWGDSNETEVGALVWAVGSPFGLERSITFGILSAKHRAGQAGTPLQDLMQTDAAVNPGNSGGPLVDTMGRVIGINTAIVGPSYSGVSFAIPSSIARRVYEDLKSRGRVARGWFGVEMAVVPPEMQRDLGWSEPRGVLVRSLTDERLGESPARAAGVLPGDIILKWNSRPVGSPAALVAEVASTNIGQTVPIVIVRDGQELELDVTVGERPATID